MEESAASVLRGYLPRSSKELVKRGLESFLCAPLRRWYRGVGSVLMYHRVTEFEDFSVSWNDSTSFYPHLGLSVHTERFRQQMEYIASSCTPLALGDLGRALRGSPSRVNPYIVVTFDDGYLDNLELALPIIERYEVPITIFVTTGFVSRAFAPWWLLLEDRIQEGRDIQFGGERFSCGSISDKRATFTHFERAFRNATAEEQDRYLRELDLAATEEWLEKLYLSWDQVKELDKHPLVTIGAHTERHPVLAQESRQTVRLELHHSKKVLEDLLGHEVPFFAYPFGSVQACGLRESEVAAEVEFEFSFTTRSGHLFAKHLQYPRLIPRITVDYFDDLSSFRRKLSGVDSISADPLSRFVTV